MKYDNWFNKYKPTVNIFSSDRPYGNTVFETFGEELDFVKKQKTIDSKQIWTLIDGYDNRLYIVPGYWTINRLGYFITEKSWKNRDIEIKV